MNESNITASITNERFPFCNECSFDEGVIHRFSAGTKDPYETDFGAVAPRFSGSISFVASTLIVYLILRSETRLSTTYHRLLFGMSVSDMMSSFAMALTSLPFPTHMVSESRP